MNWQVYIILCSDNSLYKGITTEDMATKHRARHRPIMLGKFPGGASGPGTSIG
jgi:predicted GIY-YIG superfamily endonuclease